MHLTQTTMKTKIIIILIALHLFFAKGYGQVWSTLSSGTNGNVYATAVYNGELYVGGTFTQAGGISVSNIAKWNGTSWSAMPGIYGSLATVRALIVYNGELYAGGTFTQAGSLGSNTTINIAKWDGTNWSVVGAGQNGRINAFAVYNSELYVGGGFTNAIAKWNGTTWSSVATGLNNNINALAVYNSELYAGGDFNGSPAPSDYVAKWNGTSWLAVSSGTNNTVYALATYNAELYMGGIFTMAGAVSAANIVKWDGTSFISFGGTGTSGDVRSLVVYGTSIYAGGLFNSVNGTSIHNVVQWNGTIWTKLLAGVTDFVFTLCVYNNDLYAGGQFNYANNNTAYYVAKWNDGISGIMENQTQTTMSVYPNPAQNIVSISSAEKIKSITCFTSVGQIIDVKFENNSINVSSLEKGLYFLNITAENGTKSAQKFIKE